MNRNTLSLITAHACTMETENQSHKLTREFWVNTPGKNPEGKTRYELILLKKSWAPVLG
jgi:hypothetical protein